MHRISTISNPTSRSEGHYRLKDLWRCGSSADEDDPSQESCISKAFNVSRSERANLKWLDISTTDKIVPDKTFQKLMNSISPAGLGTGSKYDWGAEQQLPAEYYHAVRWSIFDLFENDLGPNEPRPLVIHEASLIAQISSVLSICICFWSVWYSTLMFSFWPVLKNDWKWGRDTWLYSSFIVVDIICDVIFFLLTVLRQRTTVLDLLTCMETIRPKTLALNELKSKGFWIDLLTCFPWRVIKGDALHYVLLVKILRVRHLTRRKSASVVIDRDLVLITKLLSFVMLGGHVLSCCYFLIAYETKSFSRHPYFELTESPYGFFDFYTFSLRAATYLILGADLEGYNDIENTLIFFCTLLGVMVNALVFSQIIVLISRRSTLETQMVEESNNTREAMQTLGLPSMLQLRILAHYAYERVHRGHGTIVKLLGGLSEQLNFELHLARHYRLVTAVPFFKRSHPYVLREIVLVLTDVIFLPGDWICRLGDEGKEMFFLHRGCCSVLSDQLACLRQVKQGDYFGEISLLTGVQRTAYVRADTFSIVAALTKDKFDLIMRRFPQELQVIVTGFSEEQKTLLLNIRSQLRAARESTTATRVSMQRPDGDNGGAGFVPRRFSLAKAASARQSDEDVHQISAEGYKASQLHKQLKDDSDSDSEEGFAVSRRSSIKSRISILSHRASITSRNSITSSRESGAITGTSDRRISVTATPVLEKAKLAVAALNPWSASTNSAQFTAAGDEKGLTSTNTTTTVRQSTSSIKSNDSPLNLLQVTPAPGNGQEDMGSPRGAQSKGLGFMRTMVSKLARQRSGALGKQITPAESQGPAMDGQTSDASVSPRVSASPSIAYQSEERADLPKAEMPESPQGEGPNGPSGMMKRRPSVLGAALGLGGGGFGIGAPSSPSRPPQNPMQRRGTLSSIAFNAAAVVGGAVGGTVGGAARRKSHAFTMPSSLAAHPVLHHAGTTGLLLSKPAENSDVQPSDPTAPVEPEGTPKVEKAIDLDAISKAADEVSQTAQELHESSEQADQLTIEIQTGHQEVYHECATLEEVWLSKRAEIRDERRDVLATIDVLIAQVTEAHEDLTRLLALEEDHDDVALQALNIVDNMIEKKEATDQRKPALLIASVSSIESEPPRRRSG
jgi:CRP-like cAMP-binding protein